jgi:hypothetical protein
MPTQIYLVFTDDWELRGDGSGDPTLIQFRPLRELTRHFAERSIRGSFNAEVMQQLAFRRLQEEHSHLKHWADEWEEVVKEAFRQGHDFQLHIHPQWNGATYDGTRWSLPGSWSIREHSPEDAASMITQGVGLLQGLLQPIDPHYRCVSFRAGAWALAPSEFMLQLLASHRIGFDISIVKGISFRNRVQVDYIRAEEGFFPFYPNMQDARKVADRIEPVICIPTLTFPEGWWVLIRRDARKVARSLPGKKPAPVPRTDSGAYNEWVEQLSLPTRICRRLGAYITGRWIISDIAQLDYEQLSAMMAYVRTRARRSKLAKVPIILTNHTKDIASFEHIARFLDDVAIAPDICCITLTELAQMLEEGCFSIRVSDSARGRRCSASV